MLSPSFEERLPSTSHSIITMLSGPGTGTFEFGFDCRASLTTMKPCLKSLNCWQAAAASCVGEASAGLGGSRCSLCLGRRAWSSGGSLLCSPSHLKTRQRRSDSGLEPVALTVGLISPLSRCRPVSSRSHSESCSRTGAWCARR